MNLRPATPADLELLRRWDEQAHVGLGNDECFVYRLYRAEWTRAAQQATAEDA